MTTIDDHTERLSREVSATDDTRRVAFDRLTQSRLDRAYRLAATILDRDEEAQDAVHDAAVRAWAAWGGLRDEARFDAWFDRIVVNACRDRLRRRATATRKVAELWRRPIVDGSREWTVEEAAIRNALDVLTPDHRIVVVLRYFDDLSIDDIAARTGRRTGTVKSRLHYGLRELRAAYDAAERGGSDR